MYDEFTGLMESKNITWGRKPMEKIIHSNFNVT